MLFTGLQRKFRRDLSCGLDLPLWKLDGAVIRDESAYGHLCTVSGASWTPRGRWFNDLDDVISVAHNNVLNVGQADLSFFGWFNRSNSANNGQIVSKRDGAGIGYQVYIHGSGRPVMRLNDGVTTVETFLTASTYEDSLWHSFYAFFDYGATMNMYIDTTALTPLDISTVTGDTSNIVSLAIGSNSWAGYIAEIVAYKKLATLSEYLNYRLATKWRYGL